ncbi:PLP-dependent aminotransferase family protein [Burkholderia pseudomallei]|uniref:aminotransferase-like domain-containing protein n=1 Tax=Burkholderia pseudomallei TaxID=28450 RepID=UPI001A9F125F|nr:PLP-dependent aminotransferase family protein [Burkholderia pseudomallei]MBO7791352.1 PLP-dependent aminotransferase family protein [Burkholderia pseudomallei]MBO7862173.1 PLP-dependent aminotransferase family protein [Burkholderia pseudomallei]MBO7873976.1 PLP-dependent aminotransferase family protein [Burkholderia pseudomallei]QTB35958.1 PLP-dependent aminotransferase family protein [Burkholderia pseudomallei]QWJ94517.1 PLP-dependent aminotransferase family protein [Burkholderia pseudomal
MSTVPLAQIPAPHDTATLTLVDQLVQWARRRIDERVFRPGMRMPSIRKLALDKSVSRFTVVEAYERLVAQGYLDSRRGSGFYVRERAPGQQPVGASGGARAQPVHNTIDVVWLLRNMLHTVSPEKGPGLGYLPSRWLDGELITSALRALGRQSGAQMLGFGSAQGFLPLRQQLQTRLAEFEIGATPDQLVLVSGITQAIDLIARHCVRPGDAVIVGDPAWFQMFGRFASQGAQLVGMPYTPDGPDLDALENLVQMWRPKMLVINSVLHNPTGTSLSAAQAFRILKLAEAYDFLVVEDDVYGDLCPPSYPATRLASLDQLRRVIFLGSFSKTLAANLRVGYIACAPELAKALTDQKMLVGMTTPELNERVLYKVLTEGHYRRHVERLRARLDGVRDKTARMLERTGMRLFTMPAAGMFLWADTGVDSDALAAAAHEEGFLLTPGSLFSPQQSPSTWTRFNVANCGDPALPAFLGRYLDRVNRRAS